MKHIAIFAALCADACTQLSLAQVATPAILQIDLTNNVVYFQDTSDISKYATAPNVTAPAISFRNFYRVEGAADIVAVNGQPMKGAYANAAVAMVLRTAPTPGQTIADMVRQAISVITFEILKGDGASIGTIVASGLAAGEAPPGSPTAAAAGNFAITGGTGAFLGARGQMSTAAAAPGVVVQRNASITEDPANRRRNGGGTQRWIAHVIPMSTPEVLTTASGPAVFHADFSPVTAARPTKSGEILIVQATGLGPTVPGVHPGQPFPADACPAVNSPLAVTVNGQDAEVVNGCGWPGLVDTYRVDFRVPPGMVAGTASVQLSAAWISGPPVSIRVQ